MFKRSTNTGLWFGTFFHTLGIVIPTDFHIFQRGWSTTDQPEQFANWKMTMFQSLNK